MAVETGLDLNTVLTADDGLFATIYAIWTEIRENREKRK